MNNDQRNYESLFRKSNNTRATYPTTSNIGDFSVTYMDTVKVEEIERDLIKLANEYNDKITRLFRRLMDVPSVTKEWVGNQSNYYFNVISSDKSKFLNFGNNLRDVANKLDSDLTKVTGSVSKLVRLEEEARYNDKI